MLKNMRVNGERLWGSLLEMAQIGGTAKGGCNRVGLSDEDKLGRDLFISWCETEGCSIRFDELGNLFATRPGVENVPPVLIGSHLDTQPTGGKFDGVYGVLGGLEVVRTLNSYDIATTHPIELVVWANEEGARFSPAMLGSGVWCGEFTKEFALGRTDKEGISIEDELIRHGWDLEAECAPFKVKSAFELHIEQGPVLEHANLQIGIVLGVQGMRWYDLTLTGNPVHAGPTPMEHRQDPFKGLTLITSAMYDMVAREMFAPLSRLTFGDIRAIPGARNTVPEHLILAVDMRHPNQDMLEEMDSAFYALVEEIAPTVGLEAQIRIEWDSPAVTFDQNCINYVRDSVSELGYEYMEMFSGAGHDSVYVSRVVPTSMIFVPCEGGVSHNERESAKKEDLEAGCNVLLGAVYRSAK